MKLRNSLLLILTLLTSVTMTVFASEEASEAPQGDAILAGYDAVAYFTQNAAVKGSSDYVANHNGTTYHFSSAENRDLFVAQPNKYEPQYGGFCAYGAALGKKFDVNGKAFEIVDGKLYVNKNEDVYDVWVEDKEENIATADQKWTTIASIPADQL